jgi:hypothetical protein
MRRLPSLGQRCFPAALLLSAALSSLAAAPAFSESGLEFSGALLADVSVLQTLSEGAGGVALAGDSQLTLNLVNVNRQTAKVEASAILTLLYGAYADQYQAALSQAVGAGLAPGVLTLLASNGAAVVVDLRKLYLAVFTRWLDVYLGRQIVNFGVGKLFSPLDLFSRPLLSDLNFARTGSDAVRLKAQFGEASGLDAIGAFDEEGGEPATALKLYANLAGFDLAAVGLYRDGRREFAAGADFKGDLVVGLYGEAVQHFLADSGASWFEGMAGADYSVAGALFLCLEYYYNGGGVQPGSLSPEQLAASPQLFLNRHYLYFAARYAPNEFTGVSASVVCDIPAAAFLPTLQCSLSVAQNAEVLFYGRLFLGDIRGGGANSGTDLQYGVQVAVSF